MKHGNGEMTEDAKLTSRRCTAIKSLIPSEVEFLETGEENSNEYEDLRVKVLTGILCAAQAFSHMNWPTVGKYSNPFKELCVVGAPESALVVKIGRAHV